MSHRALEAIVSEIREPGKPKESREELAEGGHLKDGVARRVTRLS